MITVYFDGSCAPRNPGGRCRGGAVITRDGELIKELADEYVPKIKGRTSNNLAEYFALYIALEYLLSNDLNGEMIDVYGDSDLVISQMCGRMHIGRKGIYSDMAMQVKNIAKHFKIIRYTWVPREENEWADYLSNKVKNK